MASASPSTRPNDSTPGDVTIAGDEAAVIDGLQADVVTLAELGFARCTLQAAVPNDAAQTEIADLNGLDGYAPGSSAFIDNMLKFFVN